MKGNTKEIIKRQLLIIELLLSGKYISTSDIQKHLVDNGLQTAIRTIQRDMVMLEEMLLIEARKDDKPYSWRWQPVLTVTGQTNELSLSQAIALRLVESELKSVIPADLYEQLHPLFLKANFLVGLTELRQADVAHTKHQVLEPQASTKETSTQEKSSDLMASIAMSLKKHHVRSQSILQRIIINFRATKSKLQYRDIKINNCDSSVVQHLAKEITLTEFEQLLLQQLHQQLDAKQLDWLATLIK